MNNSCLLALTMVCGLALTSCDLDSSSENHQTAFLPLNAQGRLLYADQTTDTLAVQSTDSWRLEVAATNSTPFFTITPTEYKVPANHLAVVPIVMTSTPNTTGEIRNAQLRLTTVFEKLGTLQMPVMQTSWLNILAPAPTTLGGRDDKAVAPTFTARVAAEGGKSKLIFRLYSNDKAQQRVISEADWLAVPAHQDGYGAGRHEVELTVAPNPTKTERTTTVSISSAGVTTKVSYTQAGQP